MNATTPMPLNDEWTDLSSEARSTLLNELTRVADPTRIAVTPVPALVYISILYLSAKLCEYGLSQSSSRYRGMSFGNQRTCVIYILNIIYTSAALIVALIASPLIASHYTTLRLDLVRVGATLIAGLYIFELSYRESMRWQMITHHMFTLFVIFFIISIQAKSLHHSLITTGLLWQFQANSEQSVFVALLMYRFRFNPTAVKYALYFAAIQSFIVKVAFSLFLLVWWGLKQAKKNDSATDVLFSVVVVTLLFLLMGVQVYGAVVVYKIGQEVESRYAGKPAEESREKGSPGGFNADSLSTSARSSNSQLQTTSLKTPA